LLNKDNEVTGYITAKLKREVKDPHEIEPPDPWDEDADWRIFTSDPETVKRYAGFNAPNVCLRDINGRRV